MPVPKHDPQLPFTLTVETGFHASPPFRSELGLFIHIPLLHDPVQSLFQFISLCGICTLLAIVPPTIDEDQLSIVDEIVYTGVMVVI